MAEAQVDFKGRLQELFYHTHTLEQINEIIVMVQDLHSSYTPEEQFEEMVNLLIESGDSTLYVGGSEEGAVGFSGSDFRSQQSLNQFSHHFDALLNMFPGICPNFLIEFSRKYDHFDFDQIAEDLSQMDYVKLEVDPMDIWEQLKEMLPNADPNYLRNQARVLVRRPVSDLQDFVDNAIENNEYPTMQEYLTKKQESDQLIVYRTRFTVQEFLAKVPDPLETFLKPDFKSVLTGSDVDECDKEFAQTFLYNQFNHIRQREIDKVFAHYGRHLIKTYNRLKTWPRSFRRARELIVNDEDECKNEALLKEITFLKNEKSIRLFLKMRDELYQAQYEEAKLHGLLETCACCFDEEIIPEQCYFCNNNCAFCKNCVRMGAEHVIGRGDTVFPCLANCTSEFHLATIKMVLDKNIFERLCQRIQMEEVKRANIDGLETCPFCDFSMIPLEGDKIFKCENIECMKESCRACRHISHIPLKCSEIEYDEDVRIRTYIENKMSEALLRKCHSCSKVFYKESGCNKMTCTCGAKMCYVCGQAVTDYSHFRDGGRCPLYTNNLRQFHLNRVLEGAQSAKAELGINDNPNKLKFDPTKNLELQVN